MFIVTEKTPNPNTLRFIFNQSAVINKNINFIQSQKEEKIPDLIFNLFLIDEVGEILINESFVSITKKDSCLDWAIIKPQILSLIMDSVNSREIFSIFIDEKQLKEEKKFSSDELEIEKIINDRIKPAVNMDGGDIEFIKLENGVVFVRLMGACRGCPSSSVTLKDGVERMIKHYFPNVESVESLD